ncbi:unnamed protein product [Protopolystoma xenopodis]|uniref:Uncharacterized protein n=1 Tax=Protopolystoma xenopodis TaxID=117903 RepID=A0A3S5BSZ6_9PLAT|nr:unnamed protein product [Protopolystoma xenopodis]
MWRHQHPCPQSAEITSVRLLLGHFDPVDCHLRGQCLRMVPRPIGHLFTLPPIVPGVVIQGCGSIRNPLPSCHIKVPSCSVGSRPHLPVYVISPHHCHRIRATQGVVLPSASSQTYSTSP